MMRKNISVLLLINFDDNHYQTYQTSDHIALHCCPCIYSTIVRSETNRLSRTKKAAIGYNMNTIEVRVLDSFQFSSTQ